MEDISKIAAFWDAENVQSSKIALVMDTLSSRGPILFQRAYAEPSRPTME